HLKKLRDLRRGEICRLGSLDLLTSRLEFDGLGHRSSLVWGLTTWLRRGCPRTIHLSLAHRKEWCRSPAVPRRSVFPHHRGAAEQLAASCRRCSESLCFARYHERTISGARNL